MSLRIDPNISNSGFNCLAVSSFEIIFPSSVIVNPLSLNTDRINFEAELCFPSTKTSPATFPRSS